MTKWEVQFSWNGQSRIVVTADSEEQALERGEMAIASIQEANSRCLELHYESMTAQRLERSP